MGIRLRGLVGLVLALCLILITLSTFSSDRNDSALARGLRNGKQYFAHSDSGEFTATVPPQSPVEVNEDTHPQTDASTQDAQPHHNQLVETPLSSESHVAQIPEPHSPPITEHHPPTPEPASDDIRLLIGVMSPFWSSARRHIIRNAYRRFPKNLPVDIVFVQGNLTSNKEDNLDKVLAMQRTAIAWENDTYHDIMHVNCTENLEYGKTYEYLKKVGDEFGHVYTHVMKTDDDSFVNIPGINNGSDANAALVEVIRANKHQKHFYWGTTWTEPDRQHEEMWGSGYVLGIDLVNWIATSDIPPQHTWGFEDYQVCYWLIQGRVDDNFVVNRTAFAGYPWPDLGDHLYKQENEIRPFDRWTLVTHPLKEDFMWVETAEYYLGLDWPQFT
jgi:hypothetical protein